MKNNIELTWEQENDLVIETILEKFFNSTNRENNMNVELQITADCNQKCEYCYLYKNKEELYPKDIRNPKTILKNLNIILNYFLEKKYEIKEFDLFSGEIWSSQFGIDVLTAMLYYVAKAEFKPNRISIPSNGYFILNEKYLEQILEIRKQMLYYGTNLSFSISIDGPLLEEQNRPLINEKNNFLRDEKFYEKMFNFCKTYNFGFHPMVNAYNIEKWPAQYEWWINKLNEYDLNYFDYIMFLEVRNDEWTNDKIESYLKFLNFAFEKTLSDIFNNDKESLLNVILGTDSSPRETFNYFHLNLLKSSINMGCSVDRSLQFRLGDLAWTLCHRTSYEKFLYGKFKVKDNKIIGMQALNLPLLFTVYGLGYKGHPKCDVCDFNNYCLKGCYGSQYETHKELFYPCETVCNLYQAKILFLYEKCKKIAIELKNREINQKLLSIQEILQDKKELYNQWNETIRTLI